MRANRAKRGSNIPPNSVRFVIIAPVLYPTTPAVLRSAQSLGSGTYATDVLDSVRPVYTPTPQKGLKVWD